MNKIPLCPICNKNVKVSSKFPHLNVYACNICEHYFTHLESHEQEKYEEDYFVKVHKNWFAHPNIPLFKLIEKKISTYLSKVDLLDIGCGKGDFLKYLAAHNPRWKLTGIDLVSNQHKHITFVQGDFLTHTYNKKFNAVTSFMLVEHLDNITAFFKKSSSLVTDDGIMIVNTINNDSLMYKIARTVFKLGFKTVVNRLYDPHHLQHYSPKSLRKLLVQHDFEIIDHSIHNYPIKAIDLPDAPFLVQQFYKLAVILIFLVSKPIKLGMHQTIIARKKNTSQMKNMKT